MRRRARPSSARSKESARSEEHTSELQSQSNLVCRLLLEKKKEQRQLATTALWAQQTLRAERVITRHDRDVHDLLEHLQRCLPVLHLDHVDQLVLSVQHHI